MNVVKRSSLMSKQVSALPFAQESTIEETPHATIRRWSDSLEVRGERPAALEISRHGNFQIHTSSFVRYSNRGEMKAKFESSLIRESRNSELMSVGRTVVTLTVRTTFGLPIIGSVVQKQRSRGK